MSTKNKNVLRFVCFTPTSKISFNARWVYSCLCYFWFVERCKPSQRTLAKQIGMSHNTIATAFKELQAAGLVQQDKNNYIPKTGPDLMIKTGWQDERKWYMGLVSVPIKLPLPRLHKTNTQCNKKQTVRQVVLRYVARYWLKRGKSAEYISAVAGCGRAGRTVKKILAAAKPKPDQLQAIFTPAPTLPPALPPDSPQNAPQNALEARGEAGEQRAGVGAILPPARQEAPQVAIVEMHELPAGMPRSANADELAAHIGPQLTALLAMCDDIALIPQNAKSLKLAAVKAVKSQGFTDTIEYLEWARRVGLNIYILISELNKK